MSGAANTTAKLVRASLAVANVGLLLVTLWVADQALSAGGIAGGERKTLRGALTRIRESRARGVVLLGSSTSRDWLPPRSLAGLFGIPADEVLDAHINGCHQDCTWAEVRRLLAQERHFEVAVYGTNLFQLCEYPHTKRALQQRTLLPASERPALLGLYLHARHPLANVARFVGGALSEVYADTTATQREAARRVLGREDANLAWIRPEPGGQATPPACDYSDAETAYKRAVSHALMEDLGRLADRTYLLLLPDATLDDEDPRSQAAWERHREFHRALADAYEHVVLVDLAQPHPREDYTDGVHLRPQAGVEQRRLLARHLRELEVSP